MQQKQQQTTDTIDDDVGNGDVLTKVENVKNYQTIDFTVTTADEGRWRTFCFEVDKNGSFSIEYT